MTTQDDSGTHATLADSEDASDSQELPRGSNLGRYVIIEPIGSGGMGTVYRAYDPQLNRGVALKILSVKQADPHAAERAKARLIREAQALAQLSHPSVVAVHDAGTFEDDVFIAMELVEGKTLDEWMKEEKRSVKRILEVMIAAGRGLSAAHKAGLIHRDFKPGNVMVGDDGRVRVLDFGLARAVDQAELIGEDPKDSEPASKTAAEQMQGSNNPIDWKEISSDSSPNLLQSPLTLAGGVLGTPMYMAPEQHLGAKTDERTDQFGFCVVLYEALYRKRPFAGRSIEELKRQVIRQQVRIPRADTEVPGWLWQIIRRGLRAKSQDRYSNFEALLDDLAYDPEEARRQMRLAVRRRLIVISLILLTIVLPMGVWYGLRYRTVQLCKEPETDFDGVWDQPTKASVRTAFLETEKPFAQGTWERVERTVNVYMSEWNQMRSDICEAKLLRGTLSEELFDLRISCLRKRMGEFGALLKVFSKADARVVQKAVQASSSLTGVSTCADEEGLRALYPPPKTAEAKAEVAAIREKLAQLEALINTGKYQKGLELARALEERVIRVDYRPVVAEVLYRLGELLDINGEFEDAETILLTAVRAAAESRDALLTAKVKVLLTRVVGYQQARHKEGLSIARDVEVLLALGGEDAKIRSRLLDVYGILHHKRGMYTKALEYFQEVLAIETKERGPRHPKVADSLNSIGNVLLRLGKNHKALSHYRKSLAIRKKALGHDHPDLAPSYNNMGIVYRKQGRLEEALDAYQKTLALDIKSLGPQHPDVGSTLNNIGLVYSDQGNYKQALDACLKAYAIREKSVGPNHPNVANVLINIGSVYFHQERYDAAFVEFQRALSIRKKSLGAQHPEVARVMVDLGRLFFSQGDYDKAQAYYDKSLMLREKAFESGHPELVSPLFGLAELYWSQKRFSKAKKYLERVVVACQKKSCPPGPHSQALLNLGKTLVATGGDKNRAVKLVKQAREIFKKAPKRHKHNLEEVNLWLQKHGEERLAKKAHQ